MRGIGLYISLLAFFIGILLGSFVMFTYAVGASLIFLFTCGIAGYVLTRQRWALVALVAAGMLAFGTARTVLAPHGLPPEWRPLLGTHIALEGTVVSQPDVRESSTRLTVEARVQSATARFIAAVPGTDRYEVGDEVRVTGVLKRPEQFAIDGGRTFAYDRFLAKDSIFGIVQPARAEVVGKKGGAWITALRGLQFVHDTFIAALSKVLTEPENALAAGLIAGGKQGLGKPLVEAFTISGLLPIVVLSGYNVTIVAEGIRRAFGWLPCRAGLLFAALAVILFVLAAGGGASAWRAGVMAMFAIVAKATGRRYDAPRALVIVLALMVLLSPLELAFDPGLQFSFAATLGLVIGTPAVEYRLRWIRSALIRSTLATTLAAQAAVLPLLLYQTGNLSVFSVPANLLVLPSIPVAMALSAVAALAGLLPLPQAILALVALPAHAVLAYVIAVAETVASFPLAHAIVPAFPFWCVPSAYAALWLGWRRLKHTDAAGYPAASVPARA